MGKLWGSGENSGEEPIAIGDTYRTNDDTRGPGIARFEETVLCYCCKTKMLRIRRTGLRLG